MRNLLQTDILLIWHRVHWLIRLPFVAAFVLGALFVIVLGVLVLIIAFEKSVWYGLGMISFMIAFTYFLRWLERPTEKGAIWNGGDDDDPGGAGIPMRLKPPPPTIEARDAKDVRVA
jgi:hypothetical protein